MNKIEKTQKALDLYMKGFVASDIDMMVTAYDENAFLATPLGVLHGRNELKAFFEAFITKAPKGFFNSMKIMAKNIHEETAQSTYSATPFMNMGSNTWRVKENKIVSQTYTFSEPLDYFIDIFKNKSINNNNASLTKETQETIQKHLMGFSEANGEKIADNFTENGAILTPYGVAKGREEIAAFFNNAFANIPQEYLPSVERVFDHIEGDTAYTVYSAKPFVKSGTDTWHVQNGKIATQTYAAYPTLEYVKDFFEKKA